MALADVAEVLGGEQVLRQPLHRRLDLITLSRKGIPKVALVHLGHHTPMSLLNSCFGAEMVLDELGRLEHGIVA
jgi:hypothetical protein